MTDHGKIIVALDVDNADKLGGLIDQLRAHVKIFKIGMESYTACGKEATDIARRKGAKIFLDLKYHDIPNTVAGAVKAAVKQGVYMMSIHISGGIAMMRAAKAAAEEEAAILRQERPLIVGVSVLTSLSDDDLGLLGVKRKVKPQVIELVKLAKEAGLDGIICSPEEIRDVKKAVGDDMIIVTPGIRPAGEARADQKRIATPAEAVKAGADYLVIGRPITQAADPRAAAERILKEIKSAAL